MKYFLFISSLLLVQFQFGQATSSHPLPDREDKSLRVCFYNLENLFDYEDDSLKSDEAFTPEGSYHWTRFKFEKKANNIAKVFIAMGQWEFPDIIGVCEIENEFAIKHLLYNTALQKANYQYIYYQSPDMRGINVALFYRPEKFKVCNSYPISLSDSISKSRDILYVQGVLVNTCLDTLHLFVNHWPSRYGGYAATMERRNQAGDILRKKVDSILAFNSQARILIMGDFNDYPDDKSITEHLKASLSVKDMASKDNLLNMMFPYFNKNNIGTHKYQQHWGILDQIIVSQPLYYAKNGLRTKNAAHIFDADFLLEPDETNMGTKPLRTYLGMKYIGGFSDHLPIYIDLYCE